MAEALSDRRKAKVEKIYNALQAKYETGENMSDFLEYITEANASLNENQQKYLQTLIEVEKEVPDEARKAKLKAELQFEAAKYRERDPSVQVSDSNIWDHLKEGARKKWSNQTGNQETEPLYFFKPTRLFEKKADDHHSLESIMKSAASTGNRVRAIGSGHSYSDCMITTDYLVDTHGLAKIAGHKKDIAGQLSQEVLKDGTLPLADKVMNWHGYNPEANRALIELEGGVTIADLNKKLDSRNIGLMNMGGYDGQTLMGAISTSTHGSGVGIGPFCDMLKSLVLCTLGPWDGKSVNTDKDVVYYYRIEPTNGITDPAKYQGGKIKLIQNDDLFNATICNMGCYGIVYSIVLEVMQQYWLHEQRTMDTLENVMKMLKPDPSKEGRFPALMTDYRNMEILVHPYPMVDDKEVMEFDPDNVESIYPHIKCLITKRNIVEKPNIFGSSGGRDFITSFLSQFNGSFKAAVAFLNTFPLMIPNAITSSMKSLVSDYTNVSHDVYVLGLNGNAGFAAEIGYSIEDKDGNYTDKYVIAAVDKILTTAQRARVTGFQFQTSAYSLRFVKRSPAFMSMMNRRNTMMIEMDMITGCTGGYSIMKRFEREMYSLGGRPHWGLDFDWVNGSLGLERLYKDFPKWKDFFNNFNATGCFHSQFTNRLGLWEYDIDPEAQDPTGSQRIED